MSTDLAPKQAGGTLLDLGDLGVSTDLSTETEALTKTSDFLPQVRVFGSESNIVKEGKFPMGHFGLYYSAERIVDLDKEFDILVVAARARASIVSGDKPLSYYDVKAEEFNHVKSLAMSKQDGYLVGLEYLLWIPAAESFALFFMGNPTLRRESANMHAALGNAATLQIKFIKGSKYSWHGAKVLNCSTPPTLPDMVKLKENVEKFKNPVASEEKLVEEEASGRAR